MPDIPINPYDRLSDFLDTGAGGGKGTQIQQPQTNTTPTPQPTSFSEDLSNMFATLKPNTQNQFPYTTPVRTPLQQTMRYDDPTYGYDPFNPNLEYQYGDRQSGWNKWGNNLLKAGAGALSGLIETVAAIPMVIGAAASGDISKVYNNDLTNSLTEWQNNLENSLPNYTTTYERDHPVMSYVPFLGGSLGTLGDTWGGVLKNVAFMGGSIAGAALQDAGIAALTGGIGELPLIGPQIARAFGRFGKVFSSTEATDSALAALTSPQDFLNPAEKAGAVFNAGRTTTLEEGLNRESSLANAIDKAASINTIKNKFRQGTALLTSSLAMGTLSANQTYNSIKDELNKDFYEKNGRDPDLNEAAQIEDYAKGGGNASLYANTALVLFAESKVLGNLFKPAGIAKKELQTEIAGFGGIERAEGSPDVFSQVQNNAKGFRLITNKLVEPTQTAKDLGFTSLMFGSQFAINRTAEDYYKRKFDDPTNTNDFMLSAGTGLRDLFGTKAGLENLFMGALVGGLIHAGKAIGNKIAGIDTSKKSLINASIAMLNSETLTGLFKDTYDEAITADSISKDMQSAARSGDVFEYKNLQFQQLYNFVDSGVKSNRFDLRVDQLNSLKEMPQKEFEKTFKLPYTDENRRMAGDYVDSVVSKAIDIKSNIDKVRELFQNPFNAKSKDAKEVQNHYVFEDYKSQLALDLSDIKDNRRRLGQISQDISKIVPLADQDKLRQLVSERGLQETIEDFDKRIEDINESQKLYEGKDKGEKAYQDYQKEKRWLTEKRAEIEKQLTKYDPITYNNLAEELINYHLNKGIEFKNKISPIDVKDVLEKSKDSFNMINNGDRALYHYQQLLSKGGFDDYIAAVNTAHTQAAQEFENSNIGKKLLGTETTPAQPQPTEQEAKVDKKGKIILPPTPAETIKKQADFEAKKSQIEDQRQKELNANAGKGDLTNPEDVKKLQDNKAEINAKYDEELKALEPEDQTKVIEATRQKALANIVPKGKGFTNVEEKISGNTQKVVQDNINAKYDKQLRDLENSKEPVMAMSDEEYEKLMAEPLTPFNRPESITQVVAEQKQSEAGGKIRSTLYQQFAPEDNYYRVHTPAKAGLPFLHNLRDVLFANSPKELYNKLGIKVSESTEGMSADTLKQFKPFTNIFYRGYAHDIELQADGKTIGFIRPFDSLVFRRGKNYPTLSEITPEEYEETTRNAPETYTDFINDVNGYKLISDKIISDFTEGKRTYTNAEVKALFDIKPNYGNGDYSKAEATSTLIKDLKYRSPGDAVLSLPVDAGTGVRTNEPAILNENELSEEDFQKVWSYIEDNIEDLKSLNSRYLYLSQLPDGTYGPNSKFAARPAQLDKSVLENLLSVIQSIKPGSKLSDIQKANALIRDSLYIASSKDSKGNKTNVNLEFTKEGALYMKVFNSATGEGKAYQVDTTDLRSFADVTHAIQNLVAQHSDVLGKFRIKVDESAFKSSILPDESVTMKELETKLKVSALPNPYKDYKLFVLPKKQGEAKAAEQVSTLTGLSENAKKAWDSFFRELDMPESRPTEGIVPIESFGKNIIASQGTGEESITKWEDRIKEGERPYVIIQKDSGKNNLFRLVDGNHKLKAYQRLGTKDVPTIDTGINGSYKFEQEEVKQEKAAESLIAPIPTEPKENWQTPIPADSRNYWGHLSDIQRAFVNHNYDELIKNNEITEAQLNDIVDSTKRPDNSGLPRSLVEDAIFRVGNQDLIGSTDYWQTKPDFESKDYVQYVKAIREIVRNGDFVNAIEKEIISPQDAEDILKASGQQDKAKLVLDAIRAKLRALEETSKVIEQADDKAEEEPVMTTQGHPENQPVQEFQTGEKVNYRGKEYKVESVEETASGSKLYVITDGTKYGSRPVRAEDLQSAETERTVDPTLAGADEVTQREAENKANIQGYKGPKTRMVPQIDPATGKQEVRMKKNDKGETTETPVFTHEIVNERGKDEGNTNLDFVGLKTLLNRLQQKFGIPYKIITEDVPWKGRFNKGVVEVNFNNFDRTTPFHEYLHPFIAVLKQDNPKLYKNLVKEIGQSRYGKAVIESVKNSAFYKGKSLEEIGDESLVRYISKAASKNVDSKGQTLVNKYYQAVRAGIDKFRKWFSDTLNAIGWTKNNPKELAQNIVANIKDIPESASIQDVADLISLHDMKFAMEDNANLIQALDSYQANIDTLADNERMMNGLTRKLKMLDSASKRIGAPELTDQIIQIRALMKEADSVDSLHRYLATGIRGLEYSVNRLRTISGAVKNPEIPITEQDTIEFSKDMGVIKNLISFYKEDVDYLLQHLARGMEDEQYNEYADIVARADKAIGEVHARSIDILAEWMYPMIEHTNPKGGKYPQYAVSKEAFKKSLWNAGLDMENIPLWGESISQSKDPLNSISFIVLKGLYEDANTVAYEKGIVIQKAFHQLLKDKGLLNEKAVLEKYYKDNYLRKASRQEKVGEDAEGKPISEYKDYWAYHEKYFHDLYAKDFTKYLESISFDGDNEKHQELAAKWADDNTQLDNAERVPIDKYLNPEFEKLYGKDDFFTKIYDSYREANDKLGDSERLKYGIVQQKSKGKNLFADYKGKNPIEQAKTFVKKVVDFILPQDQQQARINEEAKKLKIEKETKQAELMQKGLTPDEINKQNQELEDLYEEKTNNLVGNDNVGKNLDGSTYRNISVPYVRPLEESDLDLSLPDTLLNFHDAIEKATKLREYEPNVALLKSIIEGSTRFNQDKIRKVLKVTSKGNRLFNNKLVANKEDAKNRLNKQLNAFIDNVVYGDTEDKATLDLLGKRQLDLNKLGQNWSFFTALNVMAGNLSAGIAITTMGEVNSFGEAMGGRFWNKKNWLKASGQYVAAMPDFFKDLTSLQKSKTTQFGILFDAVKGEFRDGWGKKISGNLMDRYFSKSTLFFTTHAAVHEIQIKSMLSLMDATEVKMRDGSISNVYDTFEIGKDGFLRPKKDAIWTNQDTKDFTNRIGGINENINGQFNQFNKPVFQRKWYGKAVSVFKKHIYNSLKARWGGEYWDRQIQSVQSGYFRDFFTKLASDIRDYKAEAATRLFTKKGWSDDEKYALNRSAFELGLFASTCIIGIAIARSQSDDKKEKPWGAEYLNLLMVKLKANLGMYNLAGTVPDAVNMAKNPTVLLNTLSKVGGFFQQLAFDPFAEYKAKTGFFDKGDSILFAKLSKLIPFYNQYIKMMTPKEQQQFYNLLQQGR